MPADHPFVSLLANQGRDFANAGVFTLTVAIYWGIKGIDKSEASMWDAHYIGEVEFDPDFSIYSVEAQNSLLELCEDLGT